MVDPRGRDARSGAARESPFLDALRERVLVFDGAFGTWMQGHDLGPDDFGGEALEGCNENLVLTRPDLVAQMHDEFFDAGVDAVETATFGAFPLVLNEYEIADKTFEINQRRGRDRQARSRRGYSTARPAAVRHRLDRPRHAAAVARPDPLRASSATTTRRQVDGLLAGGVDVLLIETVYDLLQAQGRDQRRRARDGARPGVLLPIMVQVTVETTGRMLVGTEIGAALTALEAMQPDVIGMNCATGPAEMTEHLRYLAQHARTFLSCAAERGPAVGRRRPHALRPHARRARRRARAVRRREFGLNIVGGCCGTTPEHLRQVVERLGDARAPVVRTPEFEPGCSSIYSHVPFHQELAYLAVGERTNANGSRKFRTRCSKPTGTRACRWRASR